MAKNKKHIDDLFKDNLQGSQLPLDGSEWNRLFDELHPKKKKRFAWWWFGIGFLLVSALGLLYFTVNPTSTVSQTLVENGAALEENVNEKKENRSDKVEVEAEVETEGERVQNIENGGGTRTDVASKNSEQREKRKDKNSGGKSTEQAISKSTNAGGQSTVSKGNGTIPVKTQTPNTSGTARILLKRSDLISVLAKTAIDIPWRFNPYGAPLLTLDEQVDQRPTPFYITLDKMVDSLDIDKTFIEPYIGLSLGGSRLNQNLNSDILNYTTYRTRNESSGFLPNLGFDIGAGFKGMQIASGLKYLEKGQQNSPQFTYEIYDSVRRVDAHGDTTYPRYNYRDTTINNVPSPRYRYMSIPISIGKTFYEGDKFDLSAGINTNIQILIGGTGTILNDELSLMSVQRLSSFNRLSLTYGGYFSAGYAINDRMKLKLLVRYDADALDMMKHKDISQKMSGFGTDLSVQFKLKK